MRIAFCVLKSITYGGGIERYTLELGSRLAARGHQITVYCMGHYGNVPDVVRDMCIVTIHSVPLNNTEKFTAAASAAFRILFDGGFDIVHFHNVSAGWAAFLCKLRSMKCVLQSHGIAWRTTKWGSFGSRVLRLLERLAVAQCDAFTGVSKTQSGYYYDKYGMQMIYIPTGATLKERVAPQQILQWGLAPNSYVLFVGRLSAEKGVHHLISAFRRLHTDRKLVIAGAGRNGEYIGRLRQLAAEDSRIVFLGHVSESPLAELFSNACIYVQPSELEGLSIALLEAMSYGNGCLVSDIPENLEAVGDTGFHFISKSADSIKQQLNWLLRHPQDVAVAGIRAKERVRLHYSWEFVTDQIENLYSSVLRNK